MNEREANAAYVVELEAVRAESEAEVQARVAEIVLRYDAIIGQFYA